MTELAVCCKCGQMDKFTADAFAILLPDRQFPELSVGSSRIKDTANSFQKDTNIYKYLMGLSRSKEKFSYYFVVDDNGNIVEQWNLKKGTRVI